MSEEIKVILEHIKTYPEKLYFLNEKEKRILLNYITNLQQKVEQLEKENKELKYDCSCSFRDAEELNQKLTKIIDERNELDTKLIQLEKEKDYLDDYNRHLHNENKQLENIRKEATEYIEKDKLNIDESQCYVETQTGWKMIPKIYDDLLNILNKGSGQIMNDFGYESEEEYQDAYDDYTVHKLQEERLDEVIYPVRQTGKSYISLRKLIRKMVKEYMEEFYERDRQVESETSKGTREE